MRYTGKVEYAVISFGGFLGIGADYYPIPWSLLTYNEKLGGYKVSITEAQLTDFSSRILAALEQKLGATLRA